MLDELMDLSFKIYDIDSNAEIVIAADSINVKMEMGTISFWIEDNEVYPEFHHDKEKENAIDIETLSQIIDIFKEFKNK